MRDDDVLVGGHRSAHPGQASHPHIRRIVHEVLAGLDGKFAAMYSRRWAGLRSSPRGLLRAALLRAFSTVRSERLLMERLDLLFHWFVGLGIDDAVWDHSTFLQEPRPAA